MLVEQISQLRFNLIDLPFSGVSLQFQGVTPFTATASAAVMARGWPSWSKPVSRLSVGLALAAHEES